jgi:hypothetical protein
MKINHPPDKTIWFNNSSIPRLGCGRQFVLKNVFGLRTYPSNSMAAGSAFHHWMRVVEPTDLPFTLLALKPLPPTMSEQISTEASQRAATLACEASALLGYGPHVRETFFAFNTGECLLNPGWLPADHVVMDAGTLDRCEVMRVSGYDHAVITDYKTTHKKLSNGDLHASYTLAGQLKFYAAALRRAARAGQLAGTPFAPYQDLFAQGFIARRYLFVNNTDKAEKPTDRLFLQPPAIISNDELDEYDLMLATMRDMFVYYHTQPQQAMKTGQLAGLCWSCAFTSICLSPNETSAQHAIETWSLGRSPFNPEHIDHE